MSAAWTIKIGSASAVPLADSGVTLAGVDFASRAAGRMTLEVDAGIDVASLFANKQAVILYRGATPFFQGKVRRMLRLADDKSEGETITVLDAWAELEETTYHEAWGAGAGAVNLPKGYLGLSPLGVAQTTGADIADALDYAISLGVPLQKGTIDAGLTLWPSEIQDVMVSEVIRLSMRPHPDWELWIDHSTTPVTVHVRAQSALTARSFPVPGDATKFSCEPLHDRVPECVKLLFLTAMNIDGVIYRDGIIDKWPTEHSGEGPGVLTTTLELAGGNMQFQKSRIQTRTLPTDQASAKTWLKLKFPELVGIDDADFNVTEFEKTLVDESAEALPDPVNPEATRLSVSDATDLPRELVRGTVEDWMRKKVGRIKIKVVLASTGTATADEAELLDRSGDSPLYVTVTATDATTRIYKGVTQWTPAENAPEDLAETIYTGLATTQYAGFIELEGEDVYSSRLVGTKANLTGGQSAWESMGALVSSVSYDIERGVTRVGFGPGEHLGPADWLELQRNMRRREVNWISAAERTSNELGAQDSPGSKGDSVSGFDQPETISLPGGGGGSNGPCGLGTMFGSGSGSYLSAGFVNDFVPVGGAGQTFTPAIGDVIYAETTLTATKSDDVLTGAYTASGGALVQAASVPESHVFTDTANSGKAYRGIGQWVDDGAGNPVWEAEACGNVTFYLCAPNTVSASARSYRG